MTDILLQRLSPWPRRALIGKLTWPGGECATLEDALILVPDGNDNRPIEKGTTGFKYPSLTAIPEGRYRLRTTFSQRFQRNTPQLMDVPQFTGIRIHAGNTAADTDGCILLGQGSASPLTNSRVTLARFVGWFMLAEKIEEVWIVVKNPEATA